MIGILSKNNNTFVNDTLEQDFRFIKWQDLPV